MNKFLCVLCIGAAFLYAKPVVTTSILPTKYFVEQIAGDSVDVNYMVNAGADPHIYEPRPEQMKNLEKSDIFFAVGMEYENTWLPRFAKSYPSLDIIKTQKGVPLISSEAHEHGDHDNEKHDEKHDHAKQHKDSYYGIFDDKDVKDRDISDWNGDFNSVYAYLIDGSLDPVLEAKASAPNSDKNFKEYKKYYEKGYKSSINRIVINNGDISFYTSKGVNTGKYAYKGYEILTYKSGKKGVRYQFENIDKNSKAPKFIQFSDHEISPAKISHFHIYMGDDSFKTLSLELENWPTFYKSNMKKADIIEDMLEHIDRNFDTHIWVDPLLVKIQAKNIADALIAHYPKNKALYEENLAKFQNELDMLDSYIKEQLASVENRNFIVYHPSWAYFAKRYGLNQIAIETEGKEPKPAQLANIIKEAKEENVKVIFVAPQFSKKAAQLIAKEAGANVVEIDNLAENWVESMKNTAKAFKEGL
ncbi:ABC transporter substrate-binding protein [Campylobacter fetus subsp. testudinum]|uniref:metal ABC transporter solute-binding protein, Zn/Mn family n=1 Tax=Campylobacter fetus TaxID=196 RepID=UPI000818BD6E|nr:ZinT/AdcA family metal-binding protein [Campylobacter fetus]OCR87506.1 ABC transporter substrate-binding protein [Campylobacter fetus subsp. testudinum]